MAKIQSEVIVAIIAALVAVAVWRVARNPQLAVLAIAMLYVVARSVIARAFQEQGVRSHFPPSGIRSPRSLPPMTVTALRGACERAGAMTTVGKTRIMIFGPKSDGTLRHRIQDGRGRVAGDLNPWDRGGGDPAFPGADAIRTVRAGCGFGCGINPLAV